MGLKWNCSTFVVVRLAQQVSGTGQGPLVGLGGCLQLRQKVLQDLPAPALVCQVQVRGLPIAESTNRVARVALLAHEQIRPRAPRPEIQRLVADLAWTACATMSGAS